MLVFIAFNCVHRAHILIYSETALRSVAAGLDGIRQNFELGESVAIDPNLEQAILAVRRAEWQALKDIKLDDEAKLLLERYQ